MPKLPVGKYYLSPHHEDFLLSQSQLFLSDDPPLAPRPPLLRQNEIMLVCRQPCLIHCHRKGTALPAVALEVNRDVQTPPIET